MSDLTAAALVDHVETVLYAEHHANLCNCKQWPSGCINGLVPAFTLSTEDTLRVAAPLIEASVRAKIAEEIARAIEARMVEVPSDDSNWDAWLSSGGWNAALGKAAAIARGHAVEAPESAPGAITAPPESDPMSEGTEALTGREEET